MQMPWEIDDRKSKLRYLARSIVGSKKAKALIFNFDGKCHYCQNPIEALGPQHPRHPTRDHKIPKVRGGRDDHTNIVLACIGCNSIKNDMTDEEFQHFIRTGGLSASYVGWLTERLRKAASTRGLRINDASQQVPR